MKSGIYKITSPNNKVYIGQSTNILERWVRYKNLNCSKQPKLFNSLKKYGSNKHIYEIIEECVTDELLKKEIFWKKYYLSLVNNDMKKVLYHELYDNGSGPKSEETKQKMRKPKPKGFGEQHSLKMKGKPKPKRTQQHKDSLKIACAHNCSPIIQYDKEGNFVKNWTSIREAADHLKINSRGIISALNNRSKTSGKFKWKYQ